MEIKNPFETIESEKIKLGRFNVVQDNLTYIFEVISVK